MSVSSSTALLRSPRSRVLAALVAAGAIAATSAAISATTPAASAAPGDTKIQILSFNDYHGHVEDDTAGSISGSFDDPAAGGGEYLSAELTRLRDAGALAGAADSITVAAGDLIGGSPFFSGLFHDEPSVESLNEMGLEVSGVGNHEFDEGVTELIRMQDGGCHPTDGCYFDDYDPDTAGDQEFGGADFQWLAANVTEDAPDGTDDFEDSIPDYTIEEVGGEKVAFIGMTLDGTAELVSASGIEGFTFEDEVTAGDAAVAAIQAEDPTVESMVLLLHEGGIPNPFAINGCEGISGPIVEIAENLNPEIDAIVSGHTHQPYTCDLDDPDGDPRPVTSAYSFGRVVTEINLEIGQDGEVDRSTFTMENHEVIQEDLTADPAVTAVIDKWTPLAEERGDDPVGEITADITRGGNPTGDDRGVESSAGNLVADAQLEATRDLGAQVAFMNPGGVRSDLEFAASGDEGDGVVTYGEAFTFQPFNNTMVVLPMTGAQIVSVLEEQCQPAGSSRPILQLGTSRGFTYGLSTTVDDDGNCTDIELFDITLDGALLDLDATYGVAVNNFLADGGDNFETFADVDVNDRIPGPQDIDALIDYLQANSPVNPPSANRTSILDPIVSVEPARLIDTRTGPDNTTVDGDLEGGGRLDAGTVVELPVAGRGGVADDAIAAVINVGVVDPIGTGFATVYPCGQDRPQTSNVNFDDGDTVSNAVSSGIGPDGTVCVYVSADAHLIADVTSWVPLGGSPVPLTPARLLDTRTGPNNTTVDGEFQGDDRVAAGQTVELAVVGRDGVPEETGAVVINVGAVRPSEKGFVTVYPCGEDRPLASNVNYVADGVVSTSVTAEVGDDGTVCLYTSAETHLIADVTGAVPEGKAPTGITPARLLETRITPNAKTVDGRFQGDGPLDADSTLELTVTGRGDVPDDAETVVLNVGSIRPDAKGYVTVYPCGTDQPQASNVNYLGDDIVSNSVVAKVGTDGKVCIYTFAATEMIVDVTAVVSPPVPFASPA